MHAFKRPCAAPHRRLPKPSPYSPRYSYYAAPRRPPCRFIKMEQGAAAEQQEKADQAAAQAHFAGLLGWPQEDLAAVAEAPSADTAPGTDELLAALLRRAAALQEARLARGKSAVVDWEQAGWK